MVTNASYARYENNPARQLAYQLWAAEPDKPITEWIEQLTDDAGAKVALRTVQNWRHQDAWDKRLAEEVLAASGVSVFEQVRRLRVAALPAIRYLDQVARGEVKPDRLRMEAAKFLVSQSAAVHQLAAAQLPAPVVSLDASVSDDELLQLEQRLAAVVGGTGTG